MNAAKCWTYLTGLVLNQPLSPDIPEHEVRNKPFTFCTLIFQLCGMGVVHIGV